jgi:hypothetical protein
MKLRGKYITATKLFRSATKGIIFVHIRSANSFVDFDARRKTMTMRTKDGCFFYFATEKHFENSL